MFITHSFRHEINLKKTIFLDSYFIVNKNVPMNPWTLAALSFLSGLLMCALVAVSFLVYRATSAIHSLSISTDMLDTTMGTLSSNMDKFSKSNVSGEDLSKIGSGLVNVAMQMIEQSKHMDAVLNELRGVSGSLPQDETAEIAALVRDYGVPVEEARHRVREKNLYSGFKVEPSGY